MLRCGVNEDGKDGPPKRPSGTFRTVQEHARRAAEILRRCDHQHYDGLTCVREVGHDDVHRDVDGREWSDEDGVWRR